MKCLFGMRLLTCALAGVLSLTVNMRADEVATENFEGLTLVPFDLANVGIGDGTDWTNVIPGWTITNTEDHVAIDSAAYNGWTALDVDSWLEEQGIQAGRDRMQLGGVANNTALVADPDAWDDYPPGGKSSQGYNSYVGRQFSIAGRDLASLSLSFDWDFVAEDRQIGVVEVSFDAGTTWQPIVQVASIAWASDPVWGPFAVANDTTFSTNPLGYTVEPTQKVFVAGVDFTVPSGATTFDVRFGCIFSGNDWWFAVDNVLVGDSAGVIEFEDFEGLELLSFVDGGVGTPPGDGTDYTQMAPGWLLWNEGTPDFPTKRMYNPSFEGAYNGFALIDGTSWVNEQGGQERDNNVANPSIFGPNNTVLVADPDAHDDYDATGEDEVTPPEGEKEFNSFFSRQFDLSRFRNTTVVVEFDWETRIESNQRVLAQVSFDYGATWVTLLDADSDDQAKIDALLPFQFSSDLSSLYGSFAGPTQFTFGAPGSGADFIARNSNAMTLRFGCIDARNNWWCAFDNIVINADPQSFVMGDSNGDGNANNLDIAGFIQALTNKAGFDATSPVPADQLFDFNADGTFNNIDISGFITELSN